MIYIELDNKKSIIQICRGKFQLDKSIFRGYTFDEISHLFKSFTLSDDKLDYLAEKQLGIKLFPDGSFVHEEDKLIFLLKYGGMNGQISVDFPLI